MTVFDRYGVQLRQAVRVVVGSVSAYAAYRLLQLPQGYWAVFTVIIVLQGSIASTFGAALDRLIGTVAGALVGGVATLAIQHGDLAIGLALTLVLATTAFAAAIRPQLKVAPVTAAILLLTQPPGVHIATFVVHRIVEIGLGGLIGVATSVLVFPARSGPVVRARAAAVLHRIQRMLELLAVSLTEGQSPALADEHPPLRRALVAVESAAVDAEREHASGLGFGTAPPTITRALWRIRNDLVLVARAIDVPLPDVAATIIAQPAAAFLRAEAHYAQSCASLLLGDSDGTPREQETAYQAFEAAFAGLRSAGVIRTLAFAEAGRVFGLAFAIEVLHRDLAELCDRVSQSGKH